MAARVGVWVLLGALVVVVAVAVVVRHRRTCATPAYEPSRWQDCASEFSNCLAYAFNDLRCNRTAKPQPGELSGMAPLPDDQYSCPAFRQRLLADYPDTLWLDDAHAAAECPCGYYKGFLALDLRPGHQDYHLWRRDRDGVWSHKPGEMPVTRQDASGRIIRDPLQSDRAFPEHVYSTPCGFFCIKSNDEPHPQRSAV